MSSYRPLSRYSAFAYLLLAAVAAYFQVAFMQHGLKYDMIDQYLPWRRFVTDCLGSGTGPFWNPYQHWGYFFSADPQSGAWYPFNWIYALAGGYTVYINQFDFVLHIFLAGAGMYSLANYVSGDRRVALAIACIYMLSGFFTGNAQHMTYLVSGAWVPVVFHRYLVMLNRRDRWSLIAFALAFFMLLAGGYPAFTIITAYCLLFLFFFRFIRTLRKEPRYSVTALLRSHLLAGMAVFALGAFAFASLAFSLGHVSRGHAIPLHDALFNPFSPQSLWSLAFPLWSARDPAFFDTDISMSNLYFGVFGLALFISTCFSGLSRTQGRLLAAGGFFLLASFGGYTPVRTWLYDYIPMMDLFRFPSIFRLFALIPFLLAMSLFLKRLLANDKAGMRLFTGMTVGVGMVGLIAFVYTYTQGVRLHGSPVDTFFEFVNAVTPNQAIQLEGLILFLLSALFLASWKAMRQPFYRTLMMFVFADLWLAIQLNAPLTVYDRFHTAEMAHTLEQLPHDFPTPANHPSNEYSDAHSLKPPFWRNLSLLRQVPGHDGFNSFRMSGYAQMIEEPRLRDRFLRTPVAYLSNSFSIYEDTISEGAMLDENPTHLFFQKSDHAQTSSLDTTASPHDRVEILMFSPGRIRLQTTTSNPTLLTLKQHAHPGWQAGVDGTPAAISRTNYMFMTIELPPGDHIVTFDFSPPLLKYSFLVSLAALILCIVLLTLKRPRRPQI